MRTTKKILLMVLLIVIFMQAGASGVDTAERIKIILNGKEVHPDVPPVIIDGRTMVPLRFIGEMFGWNVRWDGSKQTVYLDNKGHKPPGIPAAPNNSLVTGKVVGYTILSPEVISLRAAKAPCSLHLFIESSNDLKGMANFTRSKIGGIIQVYSRNELPPEIYNKKISAKITYKGDERGGAYWISEINIIGN